MTLTGVELGSLVELSEGRMLRKLLSVMDMPLIPWHVTLELYQNTFGCILRLRPLESHDSQLRPLELYTGTFTID